MDRILLVDDDDIFRNALQKTLESLGFHVLIARNGIEAKYIYIHTEVDLVISDIRMPEMDGIALTKFIKSTRATPVILMTGFAEALETFEAHQLGADEFIAKPFERDDLMRAIENCGGVEASTATPVAMGYTKLSVDDFMSGRQIQFNIFMRLSDDKFVKIAHHGEDLTLEQIRNYKKKGLIHLYLRRDDFRTYVGFSVTAGKAASKNKKVSKATKLDLLRHTGEILLTQIRHDGLDREASESSAVFVETAIDILSEDPDVFALLAALNKHTDYLYAHSVGTSFYSVMIAQKIDWNLPTNKFKVATGALLHDIGQKEITVDLLKKPRRQWTMEELKIYENHPRHSAKILSDIRSLPEDISNIAHQHHEDCMAQGFPERLRKSVIHPMAKLVSVANEFCDRVIRNPHFSIMTTTEAFDQMLIFGKNRLDPTCFGALMELFNFKPPEDFNKLRRK